MVNQDMKLKDVEKSWSDIIPSKERQKLIDEEEQKKQLELYLPKRSRKTVKKVESQILLVLQSVSLIVKEVLWSLCTLQWNSLFTLLPGPSRRLAPVIECRRFRFFNVTLLGIYR